MKRAKTVKKRTLVASIAVLCLCCAALIGATFAWFTDTASTSVNKIQAGTLDVDLLQRGGQTASATGEYSSIATMDGAIFSSSTSANSSNATLWEPGATHVAYLAVRNLGSLAFQYNIIIDVTDNGLASALEYVVVPQSQISDADGINTCTDIVDSWAAAKATAGATYGELTAGNNHYTAATKGCLDAIASNSAATNETDYFALVVHMKEDAGNEYQGKDVSIDVKVTATQVTAESDSYNNTYDQNASAELAISKTGVATTYSTLADFRDSVNNGNTYEGYTVTLLKDVDLSGCENWTPISTTDDYSKSFAGVFDGNGNTIYNMKTTDGGMNGSLFGSVTGTIKNLTMKNAVVTNGRGTIATLGAKSVQIINCHLVNCHMTTNGSAGLLLGYVDEVDNALIQGCSTDAQSYLVNSSGYQSGGIVGQICGGSNGEKTITIKNCTNNANISGAHSVGGIVGQLGASVESATIEGCTNTGTITLTSTTNAAKYVGGIVGYRNSGGTTSGATLIKDCTNSGTVTSTVAGSSTGGFVGYTSAVTITFSGCASTGTVGVEDAANVSGYVAWANGGNICFINCSSSANLIKGESTTCGRYYGSPGNTGIDIQSTCNPNSNSI